MTSQIPEQNRIHLAFTKGQLSKTARSDELFSTTAHVDRIMAASEIKEKKKIVLYFHGGIVSSNKEFLINKEPFHRRKENLELHNKLNEVAYPIFFIWETGVTETLKAMIRNGDFKEFVGDLGKEVYQKFLENPILFVLDILDTVTSTPIFKALKMIGDFLDKDWGLNAAPEDGTDPGEEEFIQSLEDDDDLKVYLEEVAEVYLQQRTAGFNAAPAAKIAYDTDFLRDEFLDDLANRKEEADLQAEGFGAGAAENVRDSILKGFIGKARKIYKEVKRRKEEGHAHLDNTDNNLVNYWPTVFEESLDLVKLSHLFTLAWETMKENASAAYEEDSDQVRGGRYFIEKLSDLLCEDSQISVSLIGHSAGSIHISYFIDTALKIFADKGIKDFQFDQVLFLAPAVNFDLFSRMVIPHTRLIRNFRIFTMSDDFEKKDNCARVYPLSLLYLVSGIAERDLDSDKPLLGMQRFLDPGKYAQIGGKDPNVIESVKVLKATQWKYVSYSQGAETTATAHGKFDNDDATLATIADLVG